MPRRPRPPVRDASRSAANTGARVRSRRVESGLTQAALAQAAGISASYLNLIEHDRRPVAGKVLLALAVALGVDAATLAEGADAALIADLRAVARDADALLRGADALAHQHPGWARLTVVQAARIGAQDRQLAALADRMTHDPWLPAALHDVLSTVTAIRSSSAILIEDTGIDPEWRARFHRNLHDDSGRLAQTARALAAHLGRPVAGAAALTPLEAAVDWIGAQGHLAALEPGAGGDPSTLAAALSKSVRDLAVARLAGIAADACALPMDRVAPVIARHGADPLALADALSCAPDLAMRRLAALPTRMTGGPLGLAVCDGTGALTDWRAVPGFDVPRGGPGCALWPLYQALLVPALPQLTQMAQGAGHAMTARAVARVDPVGGLGGPLMARATMLVGPGDRDGDTVRGVGVTCRICAHAGCAARREPSILAGGDAF